MSSMTSTGGWSASSSRTPSTRSVLFELSGIVSPCCHLSTVLRYVGGSAGEPSVRWSRKKYVNGPSYLGDRTAELQLTDPRRDR